MFKRAISSTPRACSSSSTSTIASTAPLRPTKDPLLSSSTAQHYVLPSGSHFIVRPPPSTIPASHPLQSSSTTTTSTTSLLAKNAPGQLEHLLPPSRRTPSSLTSTTTKLTPTDIASLQSLRRSNPTYWTRTKLADKFGVSANVVGTLGWGQGSEGKSAERSRREQVEEEREYKEGRWGWKKTIAREERRRRRSLW